MTQGPPLKNKQMKKTGEVSSLVQPREILGKQHVCLKPAPGIWAPRPAHSVALWVSASAHLRRARLGAHANFASQRDRAHRHPRRTSPKLRTMRGDRPGLWLLWLLTVDVVQWVLGDSAITTTVHNGPCPPGSHFSDLSGGCSPCTGGVDYMSVSNNQLSCFPCQVCKSDEVLVSDCTETKDTECRCKPGTFRDKSHSTEICEKCSSLECPAGMVMKTPCTSLSDIKCVPEESGTKAPGWRRPAPGGPGSTSPGNSTSPLPSPGDGVSVILLVVVLVIAGVVVIIAIMCCCIRIRSGRGQDTKFMRKVCCWRVPQGPGAKDSTDNQMLTIRDSQSTLDFEPEEMKRQELAELRVVTPTSPQEKECLLGQAEVEGSQKRRLLVPANGADPIETLKPFFNLISNIVPCKSWNQLMRQMGLPENDIQLARQSASSADDVLNEMLGRWINRKGREASVNCLLEALETLGDKHSKQTIEASLVNSGKFIFLDSETDSTVPSE